MTMSSWIYVTGGAQGVLILTWLINLRLNTFLHCSSYIEDILKICLYWSQSCSSEIVMCRHVSISSSVGYLVINPHVDPTVNIDIWMFKTASIPSGMFRLVGSSQIGITKYHNWLGFINFSPSCWQTISHVQI